MKSYGFFLLFCAHQVFAFENFFVGHYEGYQIPPPTEFDTRANVTTRTFTQILDHYDPTNTASWQQRYYVNTQFFNASEGKAVFLMIGGEGQAFVQWMTGGSWIQTARKYEALLFQLEHRFYGNSHPFSDLSTPNLRFLSSQQALEDIATFISAMNRQYNLPSDVKWIVFGGSYSASLAVWVRQKYPHLVQGAMASSGPIFAKLDFHEYLDVVVDGLATHSQKCADTVKTAFNQVENLLTNPGGQNITSILNLCFDIHNSVNNVTNNVAYLFERLSSGIAGVVQYHRIPGQRTIDSICSILNNESIEREIDRLVQVNRLFYPTCVNYRFQSLINSMRNTAISVAGNMRQWYYQTCTEFGWYQTTSQKEPVFGNRNPVDFFTQICTETFGPQFNTTFSGEQTDRINRHYGGFEVDVTNVVHVHGSYDPWYPMGLTETVNPASPVIFINGTSHCANIYAASSNDPPALTAARQEIERLIGLWLDPNSGMRIQLSIYLILVGLFARLL